MNWSHLVLVVFLLPSAVGKAESAITAEDIRPHISYLAAPERGGRRNAGKIESRVYIVRQFREAGLTPLFGDSWSQEVPSRTTDGGEASQIGENLGGFVQGTDPVLKNEWIIVNAHYDHLGVQWGRTYPGADDNASGVSMLIEVARKIQQAPLKRSVAFVAFDFEESLLWGSRWFMGHTPMDVDQIRFCVTADMIGRSLGGLGVPNVFVLGAEHSQIVRDVIASAEVPQGLEIAQFGVDMIGTRSDYGPFRDQHIPFLFFSTGEHPDYHSPRDIPERIEYDKAAKICSLILQIVNQIGNGDQSIEWEPAVYQKLEEAKAINSVTRFLLDAEERGDIELSSVQRFFASQVRSKTNYMLRAGRVSDDERKWVSRTAQILMVAVF